MWQLLLFALIMVALTVCVTLITRKPKEDAGEKYVCPACGEEVCICHKDTDS